MKHVVSQNIHISPSDLILTGNGAVLEDGHCFSNYFSGDIFKVLLFFRRSEQIWINTEVDFGQGKVIYIPICMNWIVIEFKQKPQKTIKNKLLNRNKFLTFSHYILEDDRTLEEYRLKEGSRITVFSYQDQEPNIMAGCYGAQNYPGDFFQRPGRSVFSRRFINVSAMPERSKSADKMEVNFTDGSRISNNGYGRR
ncbi:unnamed protein product [Hymenolepis diminuta]|uniref:Ubiquitin-like domain-containing protein n=1 Tax=Hymenolepis diminuta TaxID=6216 RepID=A0A3P6ZFB0_HYMDI|nr:unnamed protein product [Hymenolepis diminuta]